MKEEEVDDQEEGMSTATVARMSEEGRIVENEKRGGERDDRGTADSGVSVGRKRARERVKMRAATTNNECWGIGYPHERELTVFEFREAFSPLNTTMPSQV